MSSTLLIPDLHNNYAKAEELIAQYQGRYDQIVFLGDYFDSHDKDATDDNVAVGEWLRESLSKPNRVHLLGNHDVAYLFPSPFTRCTSCTEEKRQALAPILNQLPREKLRPAIELDGWLVTHAGVHPKLAGANNAQQLVARCEEALCQLAAGGHPQLFACGWARGGDFPQGGITWQDFGEFRPTPGLHQIFAHTPAETVRVHWMIPGRRHILKRAHRLDRVPGTVVDCRQTSSVNVCLDTELACVGLLADGTLSVLSPDLPGGEQLIVQVGVA